MSRKTRIMYIENKSDGLVGPARIGRVTFSKSGKSLTYRGIELGSLKGTGFKANFWNPETGEQYWISGCKKDGLDSLYANEIENFYVEFEVKDPERFREIGQVFTELKLDKEREFPHN